MRKLLSHAFSDFALREQEPLITQYFDLLIEKLKQQIDGPRKGKVDMVAWYNFTTFDIIGDLAFGEPFGTLERGEYHFWVANIFRSLKFIRVLHVARRYSLLPLFAVLYSLLPGFGKEEKESLAFEKERAVKRLATKKDKKDFMSYVCCPFENPSCPQPAKLVRFYATMMKGE